MADKTDIVNLAFLQLGEETISDISADSPRANEARAVYDQMLDEVTAAGPQKGWKFAQEAVEIDVNAVDPINTKYGYRYKLPSDHLRTVDISVGGISLTDWIRKGQYILTNQESATIVLDYVKRNTITGEYPPYFITALYTKIAIQLGFKRVQKKAFANDLLREYTLVVMPKAIALDEQEVYVQEFSNSWADAGNRTSTIE